MTPADAGDAGDDPGARQLITEEAVGSEWRQLEERRVWVTQPVDTFSHRKLPAVSESLLRVLAATRSDALEASMQLGDKRFMVRGVGGELVARAPRRALEHAAHAASSSRTIGIIDASTVSSATWSPAATCSVATVPSRGAVI